MVIEYAIEYSLSLGNNVKTIISTDIKEVIDYCRRNNIEFIDRNPEFCADDSRIDDALAEAIQKAGAGFEYCSLVYGNIPTRYTELFKKALEFLDNNSDYDAVISMQNVEKYNPEWMFDYRENMLPKNKALRYRRQILPQKMIHDGHTLVFKITKFMDKYIGLGDYNSEYMYSIYGDKIKPLIENEVIIDIDTIRDIKLARCIMNNGL